MEENIAPFDGSRIGKGKGGKRERTKEKIRKIGERARRDFANEIRRLQCRWNEEREKERERMADRCIDW